MESSWFARVDRIDDVHVDPLKNLGGPVHSDRVSVWNGKPVRMEAIPGYQAEHGVARTRLS